MTQPLVNLVTPQNSQNDAVVGEDRRREIVKQYTRIRNAETSTGETITEPHNKYGAAYPYNKVHSTQSGHVREMDDTPGFERISEMHRTGTYYEINPDGDKVEKIFGNDWHVTLKDDVLVVGGTRHVIVEGNATFMIKGDMTGRVGGNYKLEVDGDYTLRVKGEIVEYGEKSINRQAVEDMVYRSENLFREVLTNEERKIGANLTTNVEGDENRRIEGIYNLSVGGECRFSFTGDFGFITNGSYFASVTGSSKEVVGGGKQTSVGGDYSASAGGSGAFDFGGGLSIPRGVIEGALTAETANTAAVLGGGGGGAVPAMGGGTSVVGSAVSATVISVEAIEENDPGEGNEIVDYSIRNLGDFRYGASTVSDQRNYPEAIPALSRVEEFPLVDLRRISYE